MCLFLCVVIQDIKEKNQTIEKLRNQNIVLLTENNHLKSYIFNLQGQLLGRYKQQKNII